MARPKEPIKKVRTSITFDPLVYKRLTEFCTKRNTQLSTYINHVFRTQFNCQEDIEREYLRQLNEQFQKQKFILDNYYGGGKKK